MANMERLVEFLNRIITHRFPLNQAPEAYRNFATGKTGKVCVTMD